MQKAIELQVNGMTLRGMEHVPAHREGEKLPAVLLFHGFTGNISAMHGMFVKLSRELEKNGIAAFRYDFLGNGESDGDHREMTVSREIEEAQEILDSVRQDPRIDPERVSLLGISLGGLVASVVGGLRHDQVDKLALLCAAGNMYELVKDMVEASLAIPDLVYVDHGGYLIGRAFGEDIKLLDVFAEAKAFQGDVLLVHGTKDLMVPFEMSKTYQEMVYGGRALLHAVEGADHTFNKHEWEQEVIRTVVQFLTNVK